MKFLGIDLGWRSGASGLCCLDWSADKLPLLDLDCRTAVVDILDWVDSWVSANEPAMIAVDAPTLIPNATGMRLPDKLTHKHFGRYHAGCYPANLGRPFAERTVEFGLALESRGFAHSPLIQPQQLGRYQIEVFPHPAMINLFDLPRILKYKKGKLAERQVELMKLYQYIVKVLPLLEPSLCLEALKIPNETLKIEKLSLLDFESLISNCSGTVLKSTEDQLDAIICAYVAAHWWYWGLERNLVLGDATTGYIVIPTKTKKGGHCPP